MRNTIDLRGIEFPVLCLSQGLAIVTASADDLTTCGRAALKNGYFDRMDLIDMDGMKYKVIGANQLHGVGPLWGFRLLRSRRVKVELLCEGEPARASVDEVRRAVLESFKAWHGWSGRGDFEELQQRVRTAQSIGEIIKLLT